MTIPYVQIQKTSGNLGVPTSSNPTGILAIVAPWIQGPTTPAMATKGATVQSNYGYGLIDEIAEYVIDEAGNPVVIVPQTPSTAGTFGTVTYAGTGTLGTGTNISADASFKPVDDFLVTVLFTLGGTTGTGPISYQYSIDSRAFSDTAKVWSPVQSLGTALTITIPNTGVVIDLVTAKTVVSGDYFTVPVTGPRLSAADVSTALTALGRANLPWEVVLIEGHEASSTTVSDADTFLSGLEGSGKFKAFIAGARLRAQDGTETEAQFLTAMQTAWGSVASIRGMVTADGGYLTSVPRGIDMVRKADIAIAARLMSVDVTVDGARVKDGPLASVRIVDADGNAQYHDEELDPGLDAQRLATFRSFANKNGVFNTNPLVISTPGSDYQLFQQVRTMNRACELAFGALTDELSDGIFTNSAGFIREDSAQSLENPANLAMRSELGKKVQFVGLNLSRDDVFTPPTAVLTGTVAVVMPIYVKGFKINAMLQKSIKVSTSVNG